MEKRILILSIFEIISSIVMITSFVLSIIQSFNNYNFKNCKTKESTTERLLFEQFSYEIYSNIKSYPYLSEYSYTYSSRSDMEIEIKSDSFYDCQDVFDEELNEKFCQNKILSSRTCCRPECCIRTNNENDNLFCYDYIFDGIPGNNRVLLYNEEEKLEDPKKRFCTYFNSYKESLKHSNIIYNNDNLYRLNYNYVQLYGNESPIFCIGKPNCQGDYNINYDCGIIDTGFNHLYTSNSAFCPINTLVQSGGYIYYNKNYNNNFGFGNYLKIIIRNIISDIPPNNHEWKGYRVNDDDNDEYKEKKDSVTIKDIKKLLKKENSRNIYEQYNLDQNEIYIYRNINIDSNKKKKYYYYTTNYIGFSNYSELVKFKSKFDENNHKNNALYKIGNEIFPSIESIVIGFVLSALCVGYIIICSLIFIEKLKNYKIIYIIKQILLILAFVEELVIYIWMIKSFENITIDIDEIYKEILDLYNKRRYQLCFLLSIIFLGSALVLSVVGLILFFTIKKELNADNNENNNGLNHISRFHSSQNDIIDNNNNNNFINNEINNEEPNNNNVRPNNTHAKEAFNKNQEDINSENRKFITANNNNNLYNDSVAQELVPKNDEKNNTK